MIVTMTDIHGLPKYASGKVRDVYDLGNSLLIVATDRISAFDVVLPTGIPDKGKVLTQLSLFWFDLTQDLVENHLITADIDEILDRIRHAGAENVERYRETLEGRSMITLKCDPYPIECSCEDTWPAPPGRSIRRCAGFRKRRPGVAARNRTAGRHRRSQKLPHRCLPHLRKNPAGTT